MKLLAIALDYDGTIASNDVLDSMVREAIAQLRAQSIVVLIVTGRSLTELRRVAGDLHFVDAVVAENGAVIEFTDSGYSRLLGHPPPASLLDSLQRQGVSYKVGQCVIDADARQAPRLLAVLQELEMPLALLFNRGRVMVLPQATSKATGLREALKILRLSPHNAVAIGDGENDHELLQSCELGLAVAWGSEFLKSSADFVIAGDGPPAVAEYMRTLAMNPRIPIPLKARRSLLLGYTDDGRRLELAVRGRSVLIAGDTKSGKSWVAGLLCEQMILYGYSLLIVDPEGDYTSLEALPGVTVFGGKDPLPRPRELLRSLRHADVSVVIDLSHTPYADKLAYVRNLLPGLVTLRRRTGLPHRIVIDEAHYFLHESDVKDLLDLELGSYTLVSYRTSELHPAVLATVEAIIATGESNPQEVATLRSLCRSCEGEMTEGGWAQLLGSLVIGEAVALPRTTEVAGQARRIHLAPRLTTHARHVAKYVDIPVSEKDEFVFWWGDFQLGQRARTLGQFVEIIERQPASDWDGHLQRGDFSSWVGNVFGDYALAGTIRHIEHDHRTGEGHDAIPRIVAAIRSRYDFIDPLRKLTI